MTQTHQLPRPELWLEPHGTVSTKGYEASFVPVLGVEHRTPCVQSPPPPRDAPALCAPEQSLRTQWTSNVMITVRPPPSVFIPVKLQS